MKNIIRRALNVLNVLVWAAAAFVTWMDKAGFGTFAVVLALGLTVVLTLNYVLFGKPTIWNEIKNDS